MEEKKKKSEHVSWRRRRGTEEGNRPEIPYLAQPFLFFLLLFCFSFPAVERKGEQRISRKEACRSFATLKRDGSRDACLTSSVMDEHSGG